MTGEDLLRNIEVLLPASCRVERSFFTAAVLALDEVDRLMRREGKLDIQRTKGDVGASFDMAVLTDDFLNFVDYPIYDGYYTVDDSDFFTRGSVVKFLQPSENVYTVYYKKKPYKLTQDNIGCEIDISPALEMPLTLLTAYYIALCEGDETAPDLIDRYNACAEDIRAEHNPGTEYANDVYGW